MRNPTPISVMKSSNPLDDSSSNLPSMKGSSAAWPEAAARRAESSSRGSMVRVVVRCGLGCDHFPTGCVQSPGRHQTLEMGR